MTLALPEQFIKGEYKSSICRVLSWLHTSFALYLNILAGSIQTRHLITRVECCLDHGTRVPMWPLYETLKLWKDLKMLIGPFDSSLIPSNP